MKHDFADMRHSFAVMRRSLLFCLSFWFVIHLAAERVEPLLRGWVRHQLAPFNAMCPLWTPPTSGEEARRTKVGCVATALEEIISYHGRDIVLLDTLPGWTTPHYAVDTLLPGLRVKVSEILPRYEEGAYDAESARAVALLSLMCGTAARMNYGLDESGAGVHRLIDPLRRAFGWKSVAYLDSYQYAPSDWEEILRNELRAGRPVFYTGYTMNLAGHAFVIDGFDEEGRFHCNFGYGGAYDDGWFRLDRFSNFEHPDDITETGVRQGFFCNHTALLLAPDSVDFRLPDTLVRTGREVVVEEVRLLRPAVAGIYTPISVTLRNSAAVPLTTPFEVLTNLPTDTLIFRQGEYAALFGATLAPGERRTMTINCRFKQTGERLLRISPDDKTIVHEQTLHVAEHRPTTLRVGVPSVSFPTSESVEFTLPVSNEGEGSNGSLVTFCLMPTAEVINEGDYRRYAYVHLAPGERSVLTAAFARLRPGSTHTLLVRNDWKVRQTLTFTQPALPDGIAQPSETLRREGERMYDLSGRRVRPGVQPSIVVCRGRKLWRR